MIRKQFSLVRNRSEKDFSLNCYNMDENPPVMIQTMKIPETNLTDVHDLLTHATKTGFFPKEEYSDSAEEIQPEEESASDITSEEAAEAMEDAPPRSVPPCCNEPRPSAYFGHQNEEDLVGKVRSHLKEDIRDVLEDFIPELSKKASDHAVESIRQSFSGK